MTVKELYDRLHGDLEGACSRLINEDKVGYFVKKFPSDPSMQNLREAVRDGNIEASFRSVHTLKGVAGNLGLTELYQAAWSLTEQMRPRLEYADREMLQTLEDEYEKTVKAIEEFSESAK